MFSDLIAQPGTSETDALLRAAFQHTRMAMIATDPRRPDNPIVFMNPAFERLTGYPEEEVVGRNCRFLQGPDTDRAEVNRIKEAIDDQRFGYNEVLNYRRDGTSFWNALHVSPVYNDDGELVYFFGSQWNVSERVEGEQRLHTFVEELQHRIRNVFSLVLGLVEASSNEGDATSFKRDLSGRIRALVDAQETVFAYTQMGDRESQSDVGDLVRAVLAPYRIDVEGPSAKVSAKSALDLSLVLQELATNATKYGALGVPDGSVVVRWKRDGDAVTFDWIENDGPPAKEPEEPGFGTQLIRMIAGGSGNEDSGLEFTREGVRCRFSAPLADDQP